MFLINYIRIFSRHTVPTETHHTEERFTEDATRHLADALATIDEDNTYLLDLETNFISSVFHLDLETVALEADLVELDGLQHATLVALEAGCGVVHLEACDEAHVFRGEVTHQHTTDGPVHDIHTTDVAAADGHVVALIVTGGIETGQVVGIMAEVCIHLEDIVVMMR